MSLNGLDAQNVRDSFDRAVAETTGWFLLKYVSRDTVELLDSGTAGVSEARSAISQYEDKSPLYGLIMFRRRRVLIKYIPEGTSRLLQARTTVHFQDILEKYIPYEALLEVTSADALNDTSLAAAFPMHTGVSANSIKKLDEISEDQEEGSSPARPLPTHSASIASTMSRKAALDRSAASKRIGPSPAGPGEEEAPQEPSAQIKHKPSFSSQFLLREQDGQQSVTEIPQTPRADYTLSSEPSQAEFDSLQNALGPFQSSDIGTRPTGEDYDVFDFRPKVKLGPRPIASTDRRVTSHKASVSVPTRPTSSLPAGYQAKKRQTDTHQRTASSAAWAPSPSLSTRDSSPKPSTGTNSPKALPPLPSPPPIPDVPEFLSPRPNSRGSGRSNVSRSKGALTPEKQRLKKALEMRKKQLEMAHASEETAAAEADVDAAKSSVIQPVAEDKKANDSNAVYEADGPVQADYKTPTTDSGIKMGIALGNQPLLSDRKLPREEAKQDLVGLGLIGATESIDAGPVVEEASRNGEGEDRTNTTTSDKEGPQVTLGSDIQPVSDDQVRDMEQDRQHDGASDQAPSNSLPEEQTSHGIETINEMTGSLPAIASDAQVTPDSTVGGPNMSSEPSAMQHRHRGRISPEREAPEDLHITSPKSPEKSEEVLKRRQGLIIPSPTLVTQDLHESNDNTDDDTFSDDDFDLATLHEAKPVIVARSPVTPVIARRTSSVSPVTTSQSDKQSPLDMTPRSMHTHHTGSEASITPADPYDLSPPPAKQSMIPRGQPLTTSTPASPDLPQGEALPMMRKTSEGISKRIAVLTERSSRESSPPTNNRTLDSAFAPRQSSLQAAAELRPNSARWNALPALPQDQGEADRSHATYNVQNDPTTGRDSVSVTAKIVRSVSPDKSIAQQSDTAYQGLRQSPITINHTRGTSQTSLPRFSPTISNNRIFPPVEIPGRVSPTKSPIQPERAVSPIETTVSPVENNRTSRSIFTRHRKTESRAQSRAPSPIAKDDVSRPASRQTSRPPSRADGRFSRQQSRNEDLPMLQSPRSGEADDELQPLQKSNIASRIFRRMSAIGGGSKRRPSPGKALSPTTSNGQVASPGSRKQSTVSTMDYERDVPPSATVGDVNVQFPDQVVWKRRWIEIDSHGNLNFTVSRVRDFRIGQTKKWHLSEFRGIYVPDMDSQELANSVVLELLKGGSLQCACEDDMARRQTVHLLRRYHEAWTS